jgi:RNA polymerase sigma-70 factor (ECF subfamily)
MDQVKPDSVETQRLLEQAASGDQTAFGQLLERHRPSLLKFVELRLNRSLRARVDPSDVIQEAQTEAAQRFADYLRRQPMPFHLWMRKTTYERLLILHRRHLMAARRDVNREVRLPERSSLALARQLFASGSTPSRQIAAREMASQVRQAIARLPDTDREILLMRTFEGASYEEIAYLLDIQSDAAKKRHGRALLRLHKILIERGLTESEL